MWTRPPQVDASASIGAFAVVGPGARIGARTDPASARGDRRRRLGRARLSGARARLDSRALHARRPRRRAERRGDWQRRLRIRAPPPTARTIKIPQVGPVVLEDDVEIGANTTIDRPAVGETRIKAGTKIDNLVQIGHGVVLGRNVLLAAQVGIAGSTKVGRLRDVRRPGRRRRPPDDRRRRQSGRAVGHHQLGGRRRVRLGLSRRSTIWSGARRRRCSAGCRRCASGCGSSSGGSRRWTKA